MSRQATGILLPAVLLLTGCVGPAGFPPSSAYDAPPYSEAVDGTQPAWEGTTVWPVFAAGDKILFFPKFTNGSPSAVYCTQVYTARVSAATGDWTCERQDSGAGLRLFMASTRMMGKQDASAMASRQSQVTLVGTSSQARISSVATSYVVSALAEAGELITRTGTVEMVVATDASRMQMADGDVDLQIEKSGHRMQERRDAATSRSEQTSNAMEQTSGDAAVERQESEGGESLNEAGAAVVGPTAVTAATNLDLYTTQPGLVQRTDGVATGMSAIVDDETVTPIRDESWIEGIFDFVLKEGIFDAENQLVISDVLVVPAQEEQDFLQLVKRQAGLDELLNRPLTAFLRARNLEGNQSPSALELRVAGPTNVFHHGQTVPLQVVVRNEGKVPVSDLLIFNRVPANATFEKFPESGSTRNLGFVRFYDEKSRLLIWRVYTPLAPGQSFRVGCFVKLDPWRVR